MYCAHVAVAPFRSIESLSVDFCQRTQYGTQSAYAARFELYKQPCALILYVMASYYAHKFVTVSSLYVLHMYTRPCCQARMQRAETSAEHPLPRITDEHFRDFQILLAFIFIILIFYYFYYILFLLYN